MGLDVEIVEQVRLAGLLHDLGKIAIPDRILQKPGKLDPDELRIMREHAVLGCRLLEGLGVSPVDRWIRHHHEWWDGSGYPLGPGRRGDPARLAHHPGRRRLRRDDLGPRATGRPAAPRRRSPSCAGAAGRSSTRAWWRRSRSTWRRWARRSPSRRAASGLMFLLPAVVIGVLAGLLLGGRLGRLARGAAAGAVAVLRGDRRCRCWRIPPGVMPWQRRPKALATALSARLVRLPGGGVRC